MVLNAAQFHLMLNHVPVVAVPIAAVLFAAGAKARNEGIYRSGLALIVVTALLTIPAFLSGEPAEDVLRNLPDFDKAWVHAHEEAGEIAFVMTLIAGALAAALGLPWVVSRLSEKVRGWGQWLLLALLLADSAVLAWVAHLGGLIRHLEIR